MYKLDRLHKKIDSFYNSGEIFKAHILKTELFPISITLPAIKQTVIQKEYNQVISSIQKLKNSGLPILYKDFFFKSLGKQTLPQKIVFKTLESYLKSIKKESEHKVFICLYKEITSKYPQFEELFIENPFLVIKYSEIWKELLDIVEFLTLNPEPNIYIRELPLEGIDTKFVEKYKKTLDMLMSTLQKTETLKSLANFSFEKKYHLKYPQALIRFRILDNRYFISGLSDITLPLEQFQNLTIACKNIFIVENKITTLSFPKLNNSLVIFGQGYGLSVLKNISWFQKRDIYYWGDIDLDGFAILSQIRGYYPQIVSLMMDEETIQNYKNLKVVANSKQKEKKISNLNKEEANVYRKLLNDHYAKSFRLEQERLPFKYTCKAIRGVLKGTSKNSSRLQLFREVHNQGTLLKP